MEIREYVPLAPFTTIGIGGPARWFVEVNGVDDLREAVTWASTNDVELFILGGGSNLLIADEGFPGLVVRNALRGVVVESEDESSVMIRVAAGEPWDPFVAATVARGWAGLECLSGIPGSTGATPIQNVGAYGQEVSETIARVEVLDRTRDRVVWLTNSECQFSYRSSIFKTSERERYAVVAVTFRLRPGAPSTIRYPELQRALDERGVAATDLQRVRDTVIEIRKRKGMVIDENDPDTRSDGSFFMNPVLTQEQFAAFTAKAPAAPSFPSGENVKLSAAWLIENAGFTKGFRLGNVGLSTKHTLALVNRGEGTAREVLALVQTIRQAVRERFGVDLHPEPNFIGFGSGAH